MASTDEREIRDAVVVRLRELVPGARIVHELNVAGTGTNRIDVAAVARDAIVGVEIKSRKDVLKRLDDQWAAFRKCCHFLIVAAHDKHFVDHREDSWRDDVPSIRDLDHPLFRGHFGNRKYVWRYPRPEAADRVHWRAPWAFDFHRDVLQRAPLRSSELLGMLWADELRVEAGRHRVSCSTRSTRGFMINEMALMMTGREVRDAVCRQLRGRVFAEADAPVWDKPETLLAPAVAP